MLENQLYLLFISYPDIFYLMLTDQIINLLITYNSHLPICCVRCAHFHLSGKGIEVLDRTFVRRKRQTSDGAGLFQILDEIARVAAAQPEMASRSGAAVDAVAVAELAGTVGVSVL